MALRKRNRLSRRVSNSAICKRTVSSLKPGGRRNGRGRIEGVLEGAGKTADPNALAGRGEIHLRDGEVQQYSLLVALGQILQIEELTQAASR